MRKKVYPYAVVKEAFNALLDDTVVTSSDLYETFGLSSDTVATIKKGATCPCPCS